MTKRITKDSRIDIEKQKIQEALQDYEYACDEIAHAFSMKYYPETYVYITTWEFDDVGSLLITDDERCWSVTDMIDAITVQPSKKRLVAYNDYRKMCSKNAKNPNDLPTYLKITYAKI